MKININFIDQLGLANVRTYCNKHLLKINITINHRKHKYAPIREGRGLIPRLICYPPFAPFRVSSEHTATLVPFASSVTASAAQYEEKTQAAGKKRPSVIKIQMRPEKSSTYTGHCTRTRAVNFLTSHQFPSLHPSLTAFLVFLPFLPQFLLSPSSFHDYTFTHIHLLSRLSVQEHESSFKSPPPPLEIHPIAINTSSSKHKLAF